MVWFWKKGTVSITENKHKKIEFSYFEHKILKKKPNACRNRK